MSLMRYAAALGDIGPGKPAPVDKWDPPFCGSSDIDIGADGTWYYRRSPIKRARLVLLFSKVLRKEGDQYFLVTPAEKLSINVADVPFIAVSMRTTLAAGSAKSYIGFSTNMGEEVLVDGAHQLSIRPLPWDPNQLVPYVHVRAELYARLARAPYYELAGLAKTEEIDGRTQNGVWSGGRFFSLEPVEDAQIR